MKDSSSKGMQLDQQTSHESKVEEFYSTGAEHRATQGGGFLSFGYWKSETDHYQLAAEQLLDVVLDNITIPSSAMILNVSCGFGAETKLIFEKFNPAHIIGLDLTAAHVHHANQWAKERGLSERIIFEKGNACKIPFESDQFDLIIGIEGPAHYNTRQQFFQEAYRLLKPGGTLLLSDIIVTRQFLGANRTFSWIRSLGWMVSKAWHMPKENQVSQDQYTLALENLGFTIERSDSIGNQVFPGFAKSNTRFRTVIEAIKTRGLFAGLGLTLISWLLGYVYRKGYSDYIIVRARKI